MSINLVYLLLSIFFLSKKMNCKRSAKVLNVKLFNTSVNLYLTHFVTGETFKYRKQSSIYQCIYFCIYFFYFFRNNYFHVQSWTKGWRQLHEIKQNRFFYGMVYSWFFANLYWKTSKFSFLVEGWVLAN